jgi:hypothetical protein
MEELIDLIAIDGAPADVSEKIKQLLYAKSAEKVDAVRPQISAMMFGDSEETGEDE